MTCFLQLGSRNDTRIPVLEKRLKILGYYKGKIDNFYGPVLSKAVQRYQKDKGLQVDCVGPVTWKSLFPSTSSSKSSSSKDCYNSKRYLSNANIAQDTNYFCACNIFQQIFFELYGIIISELEIAAAMGTTKDGTSHQQIINGGKAIAQKYGHKINIEFKNYSSLTEKQIGELIESQSKGVFVHDLYKMTWGHYEYLIGLCIKSGIYRVANSLSGGYIEKRSRETMKKYISGISQPSIGIVTKIS